MTQPVAYVPAYNFTSYQASFPTTPLPAIPLDAELAAIKLTTDQIRTNLAIIQRDDTALANDIVTPDSLAPAVTAMMGDWNPRGAWANATAYAVKDMVTSGTSAYVCTTAHTSSGALDSSKFMSLGLATGMAVLSSTNAFTAPQSITITDTTTALSLTSTDSGAAGAPFILLTRLSATPAAADQIGGMDWRAQTDTLANRVMLREFGVLDVVTDATRAASRHFQTTQSGSLADRLVIGAGIYTGAATGGDKGADSINAKLFYQDGAISGIGIQQWGGTSGGSANAQTISLTPALAAYTGGIVIAFKAGFTNTGALTLNVNGLGAKNVFMANAACAGGEVIAGQIYELLYDGTQFQLISPQNTQHGALIGVQVFFTPGTATYTPTVGTSSVVVEVQAGGGGGGGVPATGAATTMASSGGGGGGYARKRITSAFSGVTVTVGDGGAGGVAGNNAGSTGGSSSFGALVSATGGGGGGSNAAQTPPTIPTDNSTGGVGSSGDINAIGGAGGQGITLNTTHSTPAGNGGSAVLGGGAKGPAASAAGNNASNYGGGGSGAANLVSQSARAGGKGGPGVVIVYEYA